LSEPVRGFVISKQDEKHSVTVFGGLVGQPYSTPFFYGERATQFGAGVSYSRKLRQGLETSLVAASASHKYTALQSVRYYWRDFTASETVGTLESRFYAIGLGSFNSRHFAASINHQDYLWNGQRATSNSESVSAFGNGFNGFASAFQSGTVGGQAIGGGWQNDRLIFRATQVLSKQNSFVGSVSEHITQKIVVSEFVTRNNGTTSFNMGGGYTGNLLAFDVGYEQYFLPFDHKAPFQKVLSVHITLQLPWHGITVHGGTQANPGGGAKWTAYAGGYGQVAGTAVGPAAAQAHVIKGFEVRGRVVDTNGDPVSGAAIVVNTQTVFTNGDGEFMARVKKNVPVTLTVDLENFVAQGAWETVDCPTSAAPDGEIKITVRRK
jgi:hypothetical protein